MALLVDPGVEEICQYTAQTHFYSGVDDIMVKFKVYRKMF